MAYAVIDLETTGLMPERSDRVVEVAVVLVDEAGSVENEWSTLVNPQRDVGATRIHGLTGADLFGAPEFGAVADEVLGRVHGRAVVAHNASFDMRFLSSELNRAGYRTPDLPRAICSMKWSGVLVGPAKLEHACEALGIPLHHAHSALGDARAAAALLSHLIHNAGHRHKTTWSDEAEQSRRFSWPSRRGGKAALPVRRGEQSWSAGSWLDSVLGASWIPGVPENHASYLLVLERALLDRVVSLNEAYELVEAAAGLSPSTIAQLHRDYLKAVAREALSDGVVTEEERSDLFKVADVLGLSAEEMQAALNEARKEDGVENRSAFELTRGDRVVFTGEMSRPREEWIALIIEAGLMSGGVTKSTKVVVAEDPDSMSGKAAKARQYALPVVNEPAFERMFQSYCSKAGGACGD